jgi:hypothetical protein
VRTLKLLLNTTYIKRDFFRGQVFIGDRFLHHLLAQVLFELLKCQKPSYKEVGVS